METQERRTGRHRIVYRAQQDPRVTGLVSALAAHLGTVVEQGVDAVSPNQADPDGQRRRVAVELCGALLKEVFRLLASSLALHVGRWLPFVRTGVEQAAKEAVRGGVRPAPPVIDLTDRPNRTTRKGSPSG